MFPSRSLEDLAWLRLNTLRGCDYRLTDTPLQIRPLRRPQRGPALPRPSRDREQEHVVRGGELRIPSFVPCQSSRPCRLALKSGSEPRVDTFPAQTLTAIFQGGAAHERERAWAEIRKRVFG